MKKLILLLPFLALACGPSKEKLELERLQDSIRIVKSGGTVSGGPSAEEKAKMVENAQRAADSISYTLVKSAEERAKMEENAKDLLTILRMQFQDQLMKCQSNKGYYLYC